MTRSTTNSSSKNKGSLPKIGYWCRDLEGMRQRRLRAAELFGHGATQAEVARTLQVSRQAASVWHARLQAGGTTALAGAGRQGRRPQLSAQQRAVIDQALRQGARAHGFASDGWTLTRVAQVIWRLTGVRHHPGHVWRVLRQLRWSLQRPPDARWSATRRRSAAGSPPTGRGSAKNARRRKARIVFWDESGVSLLPVVRRTWAPVGSTPVLDHHFNWQRVSIAAALCYGARGGGARLAVHLRERAYDTDALIDALRQLHRFLAGEKATLLWDGLPAHRSRDMQRFLASQRRWLVVERLPGYAPELNPVEALWANLKGTELANLTADTLDEVTQAVTHGIQRVRQTPHLPFSFLRHSGLAA